MYELEEHKYLYLLLILPVMLLLFGYVQYWKRKKQREFGDIALVQTGIKIYCIGFGTRGHDYGIGEPQNGHQNGNHQTRRH